MKTQTLRFESLERRTSPAVMLPCDRVEAAIIRAALPTYNVPSILESPAKHAAAPTMKNQSETVSMRERLRTATAEFSQHFNMPSRGVFSQPEQQWLFALGAIAAFNWALELPRPDNLGNLIESMEATNQNRRDQSDADNQTKNEN